MKLTEPQLWALRVIKSHEITHAAGLGAHMMRRPGIERTMEFPGKQHHKAQGLGRLGGTMAWRLERKGLIRWSYNTISGYSFQQPYRITIKGRDAVYAAHPTGGWPSST